MILPMARLILASASPRRQELLRALGLTFTVWPPEVPEIIHPGEPPEAAAERLAREKAQAVFSRAPHAVVLAADTVVALEGTILGKPQTAAEAWTMLRSLRGRDHLVVTGVAVAAPGQHHCLAARSRVWMRLYRDEEIAAYIATGDPFDKAGSYAIQHPTFRPVERVEGCTCNVVGLPLGYVETLLTTVGLTVPRPAALACPFGRYQATVCRPPAGL